VGSSSVRESISVFSIKYLTYRAWTLILQHSLVIIGRGKLALKVPVVVWRVGVLAHKVLVAKERKESCDPILLNCGAVDHEVDQSGSDRYY